MPSVRTGRSSPATSAPDSSTGPGQSAVGDGIGRTVVPAELREGVQLNCTAKDVTVERQGLTRGAGEKDVGLRV